MKTCIVTAALAAVLGIVSPATAAEIVREFYSPLGPPVAGYAYYEPTTAYYAPPVATYHGGAVAYPAPVTAYYPPAYETSYVPLVEPSYVAPVPVTTYYAPSYSAPYRAYYAPYDAYYAPSTSYYAPSGAYYDTAGPFYGTTAVPAYVPGQPVRNFFRALIR